MESFLFQTIIYLLSAVVAVPLAVRLGLGSVLGYLTAGIFIGPVFGLIGAEAEDLRKFAEFGVVAREGLDACPRRHDLGRIVEDLDEPGVAVDQDQIGVIHRDAEVRMVEGFDQHPDIRRWRHRVGQVLSPNGMSVPSTTVP